MVAGTCKGACIPIAPGRLSASSSLRYTMVHDRALEPTWGKCTMNSLPVALIVLGCWAMPCVAEVRLLTGDANNQIYNRDAFLLDLSTDGKLALFVSGPPTSEPVPPGIDRGGLYIRDLAANTLTFTGATEVGVEGTLSDDGRYVAWTAPNFTVYWRDCQSGLTRPLAPGANGASRNPIISADGRYVAYVSVARNIVPEATQLPAPGRAAVYLYDSTTQQTRIVSLTFDGKGLSTGVGFVAPQFEFDFSADGQYVVFSTDATGVHPDRASAASQAYHWSYRRNISNGGIEVVCRNAGGQIPSGNFTGPRMDSTGNRVVFTGSFVGLGGGPLMIQGNNQPFSTDLYLKDLGTGEVRWISRTHDNSASDGVFSGPAAISASGTVVAFGSAGTKFVTENTDPGGGSSMDLFRVDIGANGTTTTTLITKAATTAKNVDFLYGPLLSGTGDYVAFGTGSLESMIGQGTDNSFFKHGVAVGHFPTGSTKPALQFTRDGSHLTLSWPQTDTFKPQYATNVSQTSWTTISDGITTQDGVSSLTLTSEGPAKFVRLREVQ